MFVGTLASAQTQVYSWKDGNGVTHYSDFPPPNGGAYKTSLIRSKSGVPGSAQSGSAASAESARKPQDGADADAAKACEQARKNVSLLAGDSAVTMDIKGDGKPAVVDGQERTRQLERAKAQVTLLCAQ